MTAWEYEQDKERMEKEAVDLNASMENWRKKYENLEEEKRVLFEEIMEQNSREKKTLENDKENSEAILDS
jgi:predicted RNase H-like nuclease (RuvC/YqgF family)